MWWIVASLIFVGIIFMLVEILLIPGVGIAGFVSVGSFITACWYAFTYMGKTAGIVVTVASSIILIALMIIILRKKTWKRWELATEIDSKVNGEGDELKVGDKGTTLTRLAPMGTARFGETVVEVKSETNEMIPAQTEVEITVVEDKKLLVKQINK